MSDDARQYIRAAQEAELHGDRGQAVELLAKAAAIYRSNGNTQRALHMLRHAARLDASRLDIIDEVRRLEWVPEEPLNHAVEPDADDEARKALAPLDDLGEIAGGDKRLIERGPTLLDKALNAWCSFCCRPRSEVGDLVAGPAGAFVCLGCVRESARILGWVPATPTGPEVPDEDGISAALDASMCEPGAKPAPQSGPEKSAGEQPAEEKGSEPAAVVGQADAIRVLDAAMRIGLRCVLLLGTEGSGKTTLLRDLAKRGLGWYAELPAHVAEAPAGQRVLVDNLDRATAADLDRIRRLLSSPDERPLVLAMRGEPRREPIRVAGDPGELPLYSTRTISEATGDALPVDLADRVQAVAVFRPQRPEELIEVARWIAGGRASELELSDGLLAALAREAADSGRGGHEIAALLSRLPAGGWTVSGEPPRSETQAAPAEEPAKKPRRRKRKGEE